MRTTQHFIFTLIAMCLLLTSCNDSITDEYAHERAFLKFAPVTGVIPLYNALNNTGMFCTISLGTSTFNFRGSDGKTATYPYSAEIKAYGQPEFVAGLVVGRSSLPNMNMQYPIVAYDLVCPNCYEQSLFMRSLTLKGEELSCSHCHRVYDLTQQGIIKSGEVGKSLYRYRTATYRSDISGGLLIVLN